MGQAIAAANVRTGLSVRISDADGARAAHVARQLPGGGHPSSVRPPHFIAGGRRGTISVADSDSEIGDVDLIIEAVPEDVATKTSLLQRIEPHLRGGSILASNSSSISMRELGAALNAPDRFCGLHFCHPVEERVLVEVVVADGTSQETAARACQYVESLGKVPVRVPDRPGFLLNRLLVPYLNEALELLLEGVRVESLNESASKFGMPVGPLEHFDEFGIDVAIAVGSTLYRAFPDRIVPSELLISMYKAGRLGRKSGGGFFATKADAGAGQLDASVREMIRERQRDQITYLPDEITLRMFGPMLLEATRALEEGVTDDPALIDTTLRLGLGMTDKYCGLLTWADSIGAATMQARLEKLQALGSRFQPTSLLLDASRRQKKLTEVLDRVSTTLRRHTESLCP
jgi:3-hydroxyacyl-CoA dehydrogenase/enoyl-CoA hydratase/3-hydroxybutyryl-CoA epimerase/3-hydroxyacyl-CoA dehydrogenase/enoyl-CoA hydratase/3-hydroxybutyryl-CoA epimerase/enoyl-CoA isomerase